MEHFEEILFPSSYREGGYPDFSYLAILWIPAGVRPVLVDLTGHGYGAGMTK